MMADNVLTLTTCRYKDLAKHSKVINIGEMDYYLWAYLNPEDVRDAYLLYGCELSDDPTTTYPDTFKWVSTSWIQVKVDDLNRHVGLHIYKLAFVNKITNDEFSLYFNYIIQRSDEEKPYLYMKRDEQEEKEDQS